MSTNASSQESFESASPAAANEPQAYDLAIVGSGIACTHTLATFLETLRSSKRPVRVAVIESGGEFWRGFPYGRRSSPNSLIITNFKEFTPDDEHAEFSAWLTERRRRLTHGLLDKGGRAATRWLAENGPAIEAGDWDELYIPRQFYGDFAEEKIRRMISEARASGRAIVDEIAAEAVGIDRSPGGYAIALEIEGRRSEIAANVVLIATGSPPYRMLQGAEECLAANSGLYVNNAYLPSLPDNIEALAARLADEPAPEKRNLLVVGSNATSLELLYILSRDARVSHLLNRVVVLSSSGMLPHRMSGQPSQQCSFPRMQALAEATATTPRQIYDAAANDFDRVAKGATNVGDMFTQMSDLLVQLLEKLDYDAQREFHHVYGMQFTRIVRRAGAEYRDAAEELRDSGKLELMAGLFNRLAPDPSGRGLRFSYETAETTRTDPRNFVAAFNCAGFEDVSRQSSSRFLASLVARGLADVNPTGRGIQVDTNLAAAPGLYVCGPLLGGVFNDAAKYWHVENVRRIHAIAARLGPTIAKTVSEMPQRAGTRS